MKKILAFVVVCALIPTVFSACGQKDVKENNIDNTSESNGVEINQNIDETNETEESIKDEIVNNFGFKNEKLLVSIANALGKTTKELTQADIDNVKYFAIGPENDVFTTYIGMDDYMDVYFEELYKEEADLDLLQKVVKTAELEIDAENDVFEDLAKFKNIEIFEYYNIPISDVSIIKEYSNLRYGYFYNNGIVDVSSLSDFNPKNLVELDFTENSIDDWSALEHIKEKIIIHYSEQEMTDKDGNKTYLPVIITLEDKLEQDAERERLEAEAKKESETDSDDKTDDESKEYEFFDENGNQIDFGSLFD